MLKNDEKLDDMNDILLQQIKKLAEPMEDNQLAKEIERAKAMAIVASQVIATFTLKVRQDYIIQARQKRAAIDYVSTKV